MEPNTPNTYHGYGPSYAMEDWYQKRYVNKKVNIADNNVTVSEARCDICGNYNLVLVVDNSMGEYGALTICWICVTAAFEKAGL